MSLMGYCKISRETLPYVMLEPFHAKVSLKSPMDDLFWWLTGFDWQTIAIYHYLASVINGAMASRVRIATHTAIKMSDASPHQATKH